MWFSWRSSTISSRALPRRVYPSNISSNSNHLKITLSTLPASSSYSAHSTSDPTQPSTSSTSISSCCRSYSVCPISWHTPSPASSSPQPNANTSDSNAFWYQVYAIWLRGWSVLRGAAPVSIKLPNSFWYFVRGIAYRITMECCSSMWWRYIRNRLGPLDLVLCQQWDH